MSQCYDSLLSNPDHIAGTLRMMAGWDLPPLLAQLSQLEMPIWLIAAEGDKTIPPERSLSVLPKLKNGRSFRLPGLGHLAHEEDPEAIAAIFLDMTA
jgi:magnesium chelatase accessory protein